MPKPQQDVHVINEADTAASLLNGTRLQVLARLAEPGSATTVARELGLSRQKVNYHVRELEKRGLLEQVGTRQKRNCVERLLRSTSRSYVVDPGALGPLQADPGGIQDRFSTAYLLSTVARTLRDVAGLRRGADRAGKKLATFTLETEVEFATPKDQAAFLDELANATADVVARYSPTSSNAGRRYRVAITGHPSVPSANDSSTARRSKT